PLLAPLCATVAAPAQATVLHTVVVGSRPFGRRSCLRAAPRERATSPYASAAPAGSRTCQRSPLQAIALAAGLPLAALQRATATCGLAAGAAPEGASHARGRSRLLAAAPCRLATPAKGFWPWPAAPFQGTLAVGCRPCMGVVVAGCPSSLLFLL
ncbi:hypothetical protein BHM03_00062471, partial [Ensete ventricosum]